MNNIKNEYFVEFDIYDPTKAVINITAPTKEEINSINSLLYAGMSYFNTKTLYTWEYDEGFTDGVVYIYDKVRQTLPIGLIPRATKYLQERKPKLKIKVTDAVKKAYTSPNGLIDNSYINQFADTLRIYNR